MKIAHRTDKNSKRGSDKDQTLIPKEWIERLRSGDHQAFNQIFSAFYMPVRNFVKLLVHSHEDAEEICQEVFAKIWLNRVKLDPGQNFRAYLYKITRNETYDFLKRRKLIDIDSYQAWQTDMQNSPDELIISKEMELLINLTVSRMPGQRKLIFELSRFNGLTNDQIAEKLNIGKNAVEKQLTYAMKDIRKVLAAFILLVTM